MYIVEHPQKRSNCVVSVLISLREGSRHLCILVVHGFVPAAPCPMKKHGLPSPLSVYKN